MIVSSFSRRRWFLEAIPTNISLLFSSDCPFYSGPFGSIKDVIPWATSEDLHPGRRSRQSWQG
eukprot:5617167-Prorocentrum_lima.AAC.1